MFTSQKYFLNVGIGTAPSAPEILNASVIIANECLLHGGAHEAAGTEPLS